MGGYEIGLHYRAAQLLECYYDFDSCGSLFERSSFWHTSYQLYNTQGSPVIH